jgi:hypothetical protein
MEAGGKTRLFTACATARVMHFPISCNQQPTHMLPLNTFKKTVGKLTSPVANNQLGITG